MLDSDSYNVSDTNIAQAGLNNFYDEKKSTPSLLMVKAKLSEEIIKSGLTLAERLLILDQQITTTLNMVPHRFSLYLDPSVDTSSQQQLFQDIFQPLEILDGQNICDFNMLDSIFILKYFNEIKSCNYNDSKDYQQLSVIQSFLSTHPVFKKELNNLGLIREPNQLIWDFFLSNTLKRSF